MLAVYTEYIRESLEETFLKKRFPPDLFPKTFASFLQGFWGNNPFSKGFSPNNIHKRSVQKTNIPQTDNDGKNDYRKCKIVLDKAIKMRYYIIVYK